MKETTRPSRSIQLKPNGDFLSETKFGVSLPLPPFRVGEAVSKNSLPKNVLQKQESAHLDIIRQRLLELGFRASEIGDLSTLEGWSQNEIDEAMNTLQSLMADDREAVGGGLIRGWRRSQDDLGARTGEGDTEHAYATPLHYARRLLALSRTSGASSYLDYRRHHAAMFRLAGARVLVHPRALYFVAAAQINMDNMATVSGEITQPNEHYISPALFPATLRQLTGRANSILRLMTRSIILTRGGGTRRRDLTHIYERHRPQIEALCNDFNDFAEQIRIHQTRDPDAREQSEPEFLSWISDTSGGQSRMDILQNLHLPERGEEYGRFLENLLMMLNGRPGSRHGASAMDLHGTSHAMGVAIDLGTARDSYAENRGIPREYTPFINYVIDTMSGAAGCKYLHPGDRGRSIHHFSHEQRRELSQLIQSLQAQGGADAFIANIVGRYHAEHPPTPEPQTLEERSALRARRAQARTERAADRQERSQMSRTLIAINRALNRLATSLSRIEGAGDLLRGYLYEFRRYIQNAPNLDPHAFLNIFERVASLHRDLEGIEEALREIQHSETTGSARRSRRRSSSARERLDNLQALTSSFDSSMRTRLEVWAEEAGRRFEAQRLEGLYNLVTSDEHRHPFRRWLRQAIQTGIYTQADIYVRGLEGVHSFPDGQTQFYGGHHWQVFQEERQGDTGTRIPALEDSNSYITALNRDMENRSPDELNRIVSYIIGIPSSGRFFLQDTDLHRALDAHSSEWRTALREEINGRLSDATLSVSRRDYWSSFLSL